MEQDHSQIIVPDPPPDPEYNHAGKENARKRENKTKARKEEVTKKARLNVPGDKSDMSVSFYDNNTPNPSPEDMEIMNETPGKNLEERTKELMKLKRKAQSFIRASQVSAHPSQSKLDDWGARTPKNMDISNDPEIIFIDNSQNNIIEPDPEIIFIEKYQNNIIEPEEAFLDIDAGPNQPSRKQRKNLSNPRTAPPQPPPPPTSCPRAPPPPMIASAGRLDPTSAPKEGRLPLVSFLAGPNSTVRQLRKCKGNASSPLRNSHPETQKNRANRYGTRNIQTLLVAKFNKENKRIKLEMETNDDEIQRRIEEISQEVKNFKEHLDETYGPE